MNLSSIQLEAFSCVAKNKSFSRAALKLHVSQSALSQRILNLEGELETTLFIRDAKGLRLTEVGDRLLRYCLAKDSLEQEFVHGLKDKNQISGILKIGSFSTYSRSVLVPKLAPFLRKHPKVQVEIISKEVRELPELLFSGQANFIFTTEKIDKQGVVCQAVGFEENVLIESARYNTHKDTYIDHDEFDSTTREFFKIQKSKPKSIRRVYFDEIYGIIDAVEMGLGRAVVPKHLVNGNKKIKIVNRYKTMDVPVFLNYFEQAFYSKLHSAIVDLI